MVPEHTGIKRSTHDHCRAARELVGTAVIIGLTLCMGVFARAAPPEALVLESTIALGDVRGRIDHLAIDTARQRLYVAELGNNSVGVVDLKNSVLLRTITGLSEPQGIVYIPTTDTVYVANADDGSLRVFRGSDLAPVDTIVLGDDADNIRFDEATNRVYVGYGRGALRDRYGAHAGAAIGVPGTIFCLSIVSAMSCSAASR